jgi:hypothetical protein
MPNLRSHGTECKWLMAKKLQFADRQNLPFGRRPRFAQAGRESTPRSRPTAGPPHNATAKAQRRAPAS